MIIIEDVVDNRDDMCTVAFDADGPQFRTINGLTECRAFIGWHDVLVGYSDGYVTWVPVFTDWFVE